MLGRVVVPIVDVEFLKRCLAIAMVRLSRFQKSIGELASVYHRYKMSGKFIQPGSVK